MTEAKDSMWLWKQVEESNPATLKQVRKRGGFTAIAAQAQIKRATELWGPYGHRWGLRDLVWSHFFNEDRIIGLMLEATFYYPVETPSGHEAQFQIASDMPYAPENETTKKLMTDVTTKALSKLGFNADVFLGLWDDNRYAAEKKKAAESARAEKTPEDQRKKNFLAAVEKTGATEKQINFVLGVEGFESLDEITSSDARRKFHAALRDHVEGKDSV